MRLLLAAALPLLIAAAPPPGVSQKHLTIERIFASPPISGPSPRLLKLSPDGRYASLLLPRAEDRERFDLWAMDTTTGRLRMLVDSTRIGGTTAASRTATATGARRRSRLRVRSRTIRTAEIAAVTPATPARRRATVCRT